MIYQLTTMRNYIRSVDGRLTDVIAYPDTWIDGRIQEGISLAQELHQIFYTKELYDLTTNFLAVDKGGDGLTEVEIIVQEEPHTIYKVILDKNYFTYEITANNHIIVSKIQDAPDVPDKTVTVKYFFYPTLPFTELEMSMEMYKLVKYCMASVSFAMLSDEQSEQYHLGKAEKMTFKAAFDIVKELNDTPSERLWSGTWA